MFENLISKTFYGNTLTDWTIAIVIITFSVVLSKILYWVFKNFIKRAASKTKTKIDNILVDMLEEPMIFALIIVGVWFALSTLSFSELALIFIDRVYYVLIIFNVAWFLNRLLDAIVEEYIAPLVEKSESNLDDQLLPIVRKSIKITIWIVAIIVALNNAGYDVGAVLAGLGIGGLAFALAAKDTVANLFGSFTIFVDKPFMVGDDIISGNLSGAVVEIGIRSTRIKTYDNRILTIPNSRIANNAIENVASEPHRRVVITLGLVYETTPKNMQLALQVLEEIARDNEKVINSKATFESYGDSSLNIRFAYYIKKGSDNFGTKSEMNLEILKRFNENNLNFAFPSHTIYKK